MQVADVQKTRTNPTAWLERLHLEVQGPEDGPPVLLLHGWGSSARLMAPIAEALADRYRVFNVDLPGHGLTPPPPEPWGVAEHAALVAELIRRRIGRPVVLVGHSNGGRIGLYLASEPDGAALLRALVLISPSGMRPRRPWHYYLRATLARLLKAPFQVLPQPLREPALDWLRHTVVWKALGSSDYRRLEGVMRETFVRIVNTYVEDRLARIDIPVLVFWGERDRAVGRAQMERLVQALPDAGLVVLKNAGHYGYLDAPDTFIATTRYFLDHLPER
ncbi:alpha/beta fold hydrolase [Rhodothermus marinus]|uniref:alpha/beta fold hydrolase n=1 Tax=Rhodothermus marinus TaxID=29549 RepID=UPI0037CC658E